MASPLNLWARDVGQHLKTSLATLSRLPQLRPRPLTVLLNEDVAGGYHARRRCQPASTMTMRVTAERANFCINPDAWRVLRRLVRGLRAMIFGSDRCWVRLSGSLRFDRPLRMLASLLTLCLQGFLYEGVATTLLQRR